MCLLNHHLSCIAQHFKCKTVVTIFIFICSNSSIALSPQLVQMTTVYKYGSMIPVTVSLEHDADWFYIATL